MRMMIVVRPGTDRVPASNTNRMPQDTVKKYLANLIDKGTRLTNLSQALNQAFDGNGKATSSYTFHGHAVLHASAGKVGVSSVSLFYYEEGDVLYLFAMGEHRGSTSYAISDFGPTAGDFRKGKTVVLD